MAALVNRVEFTAAVDKAIAAKGLDGLKESIGEKRKFAILTVRSTPRDHAAKRRKIRNLVTQHTEQIDVISDVKNDPSAWANECKFYVQPDGTVNCKCAGVEFTIGDEFPATEMLVVTPLTRKSRAEHMKALNGGKVLQHRGPLGTGKLETFKDTCRMLGQEPDVFNVTEKFTEDEVAQVVKEKTGQGKGEFCVGLMDEPGAGHCPPETLKKAVQTLQKAGAFVCVCDNPSASKLPQLEGSVSVDFTIPALEKICEVMLACEGFTEATALAAKLIAANKACQEKCSKHVSYDFGMRSLKAITRGASLAGDAANWANESQHVVAAMVRHLYFRARGADKDVVKAELTAAFGAVDIPTACQGKDAAAVGAMVAEVAKIRHGICVSGDVDVNACVAAIDKACGSESINVALEDDTVDALAKPFKEAIGKTGRVNLVITGALTSKGMENLNTLLDDNKVFHAAGGSLNMTPNMRCIFFNECSTWGPAHVSRCGIVGL